MEMLEMVVDRRWRFGNILQTTKKRFSSFTLMSYWAVKLRDRGIVLLLLFSSCSLFCSLCVLFLYFNIPWYFTLHNVLSFILYSFTLFVKFKVEVFFRLMIKVVVVVPGTIPEVNIERYIEEDEDDEEDDGTRCTLMN